MKLGDSNLIFNGDIVFYYIIVCFKYIFNWEYPTLSIEYHN